MKFYISDSAGNILRSGEAPDDMIDIQAQTGEMVFRGDCDQLGEWIEVIGGEVMKKLRQEFPSPKKLKIKADGVDECEISGLPVGATVSINGDSVLIDATQQFFFTTTKPGKYSITIAHEPRYKRKEISIVAD